MSFSIVPTPYFFKQAKRLIKKYPSVKKELNDLVHELEADAYIGEPLGKNCFKIRMAIASKGKGKSGGARVITCIRVISSKVFLLTIYDKSEKDSVSNKEMEAFVQNLPAT